MINLTKQEIEYCTLQAHVKMYQEYMMLLQDGMGRCLLMLKLI